MNHIKKGLFISVFLLVFLRMTAQVPFIQWQKSLGGSGDDRGDVIQQTKDGGYIIAGFSDSNDGDVSGNHGGQDYWIVKLDSLGIIQWQKSFGGRKDDTGGDIQQTSDGGYIVSGISASYDGDIKGKYYDCDKDCWIIKLNSLGIIQWQKSLGGMGNDQGQSIKETADGGYIALGFSDSNTGDVIKNHGGWDYWIVKLNRRGDIQWQKFLGGTGDDTGYDIQLTMDGGYIAVGSSNSTDGDLTRNMGGKDCWVVKLSGSGIIQWQQSLGGTGYDSGSSIQQTIDGGYIIAGTSNSGVGYSAGSHGGQDCWVVKLDSVGIIEWEKYLGGTMYEDGYSIQQTTDEGYIVTGQSDSNDGDVTENHGGLDYWVVKLSSQGSIQWQKTLGGSSGDGTGDDGSHFIKQTKDGGYIITGHSWSNNGNVTENHGGKDCWIVKLKY